MPGPPAVEPVLTLDAIAALTPETSHLPEMEKPLQRMAALCDSVGGVVRVTYGEAERPGAAARRLAGGGRMRARRVDVQDEVVRDGESVVLLGRQVIRLSWIGTTLLELCDDWRDSSELARGLTDRYGEPPDGSDATA